MFFIRQKTTSNVPRLPTNIVHTKIFALPNPYHTNIYSFTVLSIRHKFSHFSWDWRDFKYRKFKSKKGPTKGKSTSKKVAKCSLIGWKNAVFVLFSVKIWQFLKRTSLAHSTGNLIKYSNQIKNILNAIFSNCIVIQPWLYHIWMCHRHSPVALISLQTLPSVPLSMSHSWDLGFVRECWYCTSHDPGLEWVALTLN